VSGTGLSNVYDETKSIIFISLGILKLPDELLSLRPESICELVLRRPTPPEAQPACPLLFLKLDVLILMHCCGLGHWRRVQSTYVSGSITCRIHTHPFDRIATVESCSGGSGDGLQWGR
ncbi:hypothetical protein XENOCAPTIV_010261, partial [Xenoophorus captivus]